MLEIRKEISGMNSIESKTEFNSLLSKEWQLFVTLKLPKTLLISWVRIYTCLSKTGKIKSSTRISSSKQDSRTTAQEIASIAQDDP